MLGLWRHECDCVFSNKLATMKDKESYDGFMSKVGRDVFGADLFNSSCATPKYMVSFLCDDVYDNERIMIQES